MEKEKLINAYYDGFCDGMSLYAHWKDGVQYVGTAGKTLADAIKNINLDRECELERAKSKE